MQGKGPEYETVWALGPDCGIFDLEVIAQANYYCNKLGIDTISTGATIACAMELQKKGLLKEKEISFGNASILIPLVKKIAARERGLIFAFTRSVYNLIPSPRPPR